jgi:TolB-like protein/class 3 adenylate cyclase/Tfp pilus assembly protein PilF
MRCMNGPERRLAAILSADAVGYSRLMAGDEDATIRAINARREQVELLVRQHRGRLVDFTGDNFLVEFASAVDALECAVETQRVVAALNADLTPERKLEFRMGLHLGEVRAQEGRLFGTGVNLASRLEPLAEPGGICVSAEMHREVSGRTRFAFRDLGEQTVKNMPEPVHAYAVELPEATAALPTKRRGWSSAAGIVSLVGLMAAGWWLLRETTVSVAEREPLTSLVVLPFDDLSPQGDQEYFAHGMSEELTNVLAQTPTLRVLGRTTAEVVKQRGLTFAEIGQELGVEAFIEGSVRKSGDRLRITAQLIAVEDGFHLWSETYDRPLADIFAIQDEVARAVATALEVVLVGRRELPPTESLEAYESHLRGRLAYTGGIEEAMRAAIPSLEEALTSDPEYVDAIVTLGFLYAGLWRLAYDFDEDNLLRAEQLARRALEIDDRNSSAHALLGTVHEFTYDVSAAEAEYQRAIERGPANARAHTSLGIVRVALGDVEGGLRLMEESVSLDPFRFMGLGVAGWTHARVGNKERAVRLLKRASEVLPGNPVAMQLLAGAYDELGQEAEAFEALIRSGFPPETVGALRRAYGERGMRGAWTVVLEFQQASSALECTSRPVNAVDYLLRLERHEQALRCIEESVEQRTLGFESFLKVDPRFDPLRDARRFQAALKKMGLAD